MGLLPDVTIAIRMDRSNSAILDYYLLPRLDMTFAKLRFASDALGPQMYGIDRVRLTNLSHHNVFGANLFLVQRDSRRRMPQFPCSSHYG